MDETTPDWESFCKRNGFHLGRDSRDDRPVWLRRLIGRVFLSYSPVDSCWVVQCGPFGFVRQASATEQQMIDFISQFGKAGE